MTIKQNVLWKPVQRHLGAAVDGWPGAETLEKVSLALGCWNLWTAVQARVGVATDGSPGPEMARAVARELGVSLPRVWPTQAEVRSGRSEFGGVGKNLVTVEVPYPLRLAWEPETVVKRITCHALVAAELLGIFNKTLKHYGLERIKALGLDLYGGCFADRKVSVGSSKSMHAWGVAVDMDPEHNDLNTHAPKARLSGAEYEAFWRFVEEAGAVSLGRERDYDWMHFQFARL